ncbi:hypothetical protein LCGC14_0424830 [marine sediment metagenome]|uniref:Uncharacterized protein n=1 Tax=marine sediment metagenome TaxID=412755 RepID=A0A0F9VBX6_9ZZZZ
MKAKALPEIAPEELEARRDVRDRCIETVKDARRKGHTVERLLFMLETMPLKLDKTK